MAAQKVGPSKEPKAKSTATATAINVNALACQRPPLSSGGRAAGCDSGRRLRRVGWRRPTGEPAGWGRRSGALSARLARPLAAACSSPRLQPVGRPACVPLSGADIDSRATFVDQSNKVLRKHSFGCERRAAARAEWEERAAGRGGETMAGGGRDSSRRDECHSDADSLGRRGSPISGRRIELACALPAAARGRPSVTTARFVLRPQRRRRARRGKAAAAAANSSATSPASPIEAERVIKS